MLFVAKSSDGAGSFARAITVCKGFMEIADDKEILRAVVFDRENAAGFDESFWKINGLLSKCSSARNMDAVSILLTYLELRLEFSRAKERAVESAVKDLFDRVEAVRAVFTRSRLRAAISAAKIVKEMLHDIRMDINEICGHLEQFKVAGFGFKGE